MASLCYAQICYHKLHISPETFAYFIKFLIDENALSKNPLPLMLCGYSAGFPMIMHIIGETVFWLDNDGIITKEDAIKGILLAAEEKLEENLLTSKYIMLYEVKIIILF